MRDEQEDDRQPRGVGPKRSRKYRAEEGGGERPRITSATTCERRGPYTPNPKQMAVGHERPCKHQEEESGHERTHPEVEKCEKKDGRRHVERLQTKSRRRERKRRRTRSRFNVTEERSGRYSASTGTRSECGSFDQTQTATQTKPTRNQRPKDWPGRELGATSPARPSRSKDGSTRSGVKGIGTDVHKREPSGAGGYEEKT